MGVARITQDEGLEDLHVEFAAKRLAGDAIPRATSEPAAGEDMGGERDDISEPRSDAQGADAASHGAPAPGDDSEKP